MSVTADWGLTAEQRELLVAAAADRGRLAVRSGPTLYGRAVCAQRKSFCRSDDAAYADRYLDALEALVATDCLRERGARNQFELTHIGWTLSRTLPLEQFRAEASRAPGP
jgi:hypothetical protein